MQLKEIQKVLMNDPAAPKSAADALKQLKAASERALENLNEHNTVQAQVLLENAFTHMMAAFHYMNLDVEKVVQRERQRRVYGQNNAQDKVILIFSDHAELRVQGELRGTIPLYSQEDYAELRQIAQIFECRMEHADHLQLDLFSVMNTTATPA